MGNSSSNNSDQGGQYVLIGLLLLVLVAFIVGYVILSRRKVKVGGGDKCTYGPSYWCSNEDNFKKCVTDKGFIADRTSFCSKYGFKPAIPTKYKPTTNPVV